jgi:hypothetical protein
MHPYIAKNLSLDPMTKKKPPIEHFLSDCIPPPPMQFTAHVHIKEQYKTEHFIIQGTKLIPRL